MPRFKFRFEKILAYRRHQEKQRQRDLAAVRQAEEEQKGKLRAIDTDRQKTQQEEAGRLVGPLQPHYLTEYSRYYLKLRQMELSGRELLKQIGGEMDKKRQALVEATREKKIYEKLKDRHRMRFMEDYNLMMQKETDDIGQKIFVRNR